MRAMWHAIDSDSWHITELLHGVDLDTCHLLRETTLHLQNNASPTCFWQTPKINQEWQEHALTAHCIVFIIKHLQIVLLNKLNLHSSLAALLLARALLDKDHILKHHNHGGHLAKKL